MHNFICLSLRAQEVGAAPTYGTGLNTFLGYSDGSAGYQQGQPQQQQQQQHQQHQQQQQQQPSEPMACPLPPPTAFASYAAQLDGLADGLPSFGGGWPQGAANGHHQPASEPQGFVPVHNVSVMFANVCPLRLVCQCTQMQQVATTTVGSVSSGLLQDVLSWLSCRTNACAQSRRICPRRSFHALHNQSANLPAKPTRRHEPTVHVCCAGRLRGEQPVSAAVQQQRRAGAVAHAATAGPSSEFALYSSIILPPCLRAPLSIC